MVKLMVKGPFSLRARTSKRSFTEPMNQPGQRSEAIGTMHSAVISIHGEGKVVFRGDPYCHAMTRHEIRLQSVYLKCCAATLT